MYCFRLLFQKKICKKNIPVIIPMISLIWLIFYFANKNANKQYTTGVEYITGVWSFDAPLNMKALELINNNTNTGSKHLKIHCFNVQKCIQSVNQIRSQTISIEILQLQVFKISKNTPVLPWIAAHPINKIKSLTCFPVYFHKMLYLSVLWKYGGIVMDMAIDVIENFHSKDMDISSFDKCFLDSNKSNVLFCNLSPHHRYTQALIAQMYALFMKNPKSCSLTNPLIGMENIKTQVLSGVSYIIPPVDRKFGLVSYRKLPNIGDEMQSIASAHILPYVVSFIYRNQEKSSNQINLTYISNAWWNQNGILLEKNSKNNPVPVAIHIDPEAYETVKKNSQSLFAALTPVGARDLPTYKLLVNNGIDTIFTGCLTLHMKNPFIFNNLQRTNNIYVVDLQYDHSILPKFLNNVINKTHVRLPGKLTEEEKFQEAYNNLLQYAQAKVVITSRIHVALPCVAIGTPVIFLNSINLFRATETEPSPRLLGLLDLFQTVDLYKINENTARKYFINYNWDNPPPNPNSKYLESLKSKARFILKRIPELDVSLKVFELI